MPGAQQGTQRSARSSTRRTEDLSSPPTPARNPTLGQHSDLSPDLRQVSAPRRAEGSGSGPGGGERGQDLIRRDGVPVDDHSLDGSRDARHPQRALPILAPVEILPRFWVANGSNS